MVATTTLRYFFLAAVISATTAPLTAQIELSQGDGSYVEMTADEFKQLIGKMQRLRTQRAQQVQYLRQQQYNAQLAPSTSPGPTQAPVAYAPQPNAPAPRSTNNYDDARLRQLERQTSALAEEIRLLREQLYYRSPQNQAYVPPAPITQTQPGAYTQTQPATYSQTQPDTLDRRAIRTEQLRTTATTATTNATDDTRRLERQLDDERRRYDRELQNERERTRELEREIASLRGRDYDRSYDRTRDRDIRITTPAVVPVPAGRDRVDTVTRTIRVGSNADSLLLLQQDSLTRALAALQAKLDREPIRDTVRIDRPTVIRDTVRKTDVVTRTVTEDRVDLAAVLFANNSSALNATAENQIQRAWEAYRRESDATVLLRGFASQTGSVAYNQELSTKRAMAIRERLMTLGIPADHIRVIGNGIDPGDNLSQARRVEVQLLREPK